MAETFQDWSAIRSFIIGRDILLASRVIFVQDYFHTLEDEVQYMWPERWSLGKILFLVTRYFTLFIAPYECFTSFVNGNAVISKEAYMIHETLINVTPTVMIYLSTATIFLCLHALLGAGKVAGYAIAASYVVMLSVSCTLMGNHMALIYLTPSEYPSIYLFDSQATTWIFRIIGNYWVFARQLFIFLFGSYVLYKRYWVVFRKRLEADVHRDWLLNVIRRDGTIYYIASLAVTLYTCITYTPGFPVIVRDLLNGLQNILPPIMANRLLLDLRRSESPDIQTAMSSILFAPTTSEMVTGGNTSEEMESSLEEGLPQASE